MNIFKRLIGRNGKSKDNYIVVTLNEKLMPIDRGEIYEDPLDEFLRKNGFGEVIGGGTLQSENGEIKNCEVEIKITDSQNVPANVNERIMKELEILGAPKGSLLKENKEGENLQFGIKEGLAIYLDGVNLSPEVYQNSDVNYVVAEIKKLINDKSGTVRYWEGERQTGLYFYSTSYDQMKKQIKPFVETYPLCEGAQIERIA